MDLQDLDLNNVTASFKKESRINLNAIKVLSELKVIEESNNGILLPQDVVDWARTHIESELHKGFEWNDTVAAENWRKQQATKIIYNIRVIPKVTPDKRQEINIEFAPYTHVPGEEGYRETILVFSETNSYEKRKQEAYSKLLYWKKEYSDIIEFKRILDDISNLNF